MDIWVDNSLEFDEASELSTGVVPSDFKFIWNNSNGTVTFDNLKIQGSIGPMPVEKKIARSFVVERSKDAELFEIIGTYAASGTTTQRKEYAATDQSPLGGTSYYRLRQIDEDGTQHICRTVSVVRKDADVTWQVMGNPAVSSRAITVEASQKMTYELFSKTGRAIPLQMQEMSSRQTILSSFEALESGVYVLRASAGGNSSSQRTGILCIGFQHSIFQNGSGCRNAVIITSVEVMQPRQLPLSQIIGEDIPAFGNSLFAEGSILNGFPLTFRRPCRFSEAHELG
ncbi:hypothetical protein COLO4_02588 [Corchorus olitorius]|uniref:Uncharacterized protein n=1 Tax=Corchorus olitorius TaxID=93759 RepID=A0A1R3L0P4_9ROSI|nr:hypothetical protein COLO4_02588 [Corchorus olitorius]